MWLYSAATRIRMVRWQGLLASTHYPVYFRARLRVRINKTTRAYVHITIITSNTFGYFRNPYRSAHPNFFSPDQHDIGTLLDCQNTKDQRQIGRSFARLQTESRVGGDLRHCWCSVYPDTISGSRIGRPSGGSSTSAVAREVTLNSPPLC
jgi:hypothetical protein